MIARVPRTDKKHRNTDTPAGIDGAKGINAPTGTAASTINVPTDNGAPPGIDEDRAAAVQRMHEALASLRKSMRGRRLEALLVTHLPNVRYLSGFTGSNGWLLIRKRSTVFVTDARYREQAEKEVTASRVTIAAGKSLAQELAESGSLRGIKRIGFDALQLDYGTWRNLKQLFLPARLIETWSLVEHVRAGKWPDEISSVRRALRISEKALEEVISRLRPGMTEIELAAEITYQHRLRGAEGDSFPPIVLSGPRSSLVHGQPSPKKVRRGEMILFDIGCRVNGYCSDMTRTVALGRPSAKMRHVYETVRGAQQLGLDLLRPGIDAADLDAEVRGAIDEQGYGEYFEHALGHGIGLEIHEHPIVSSRSDHCFDENDLVTVEPGVYLPGVGGVRIEDDVLLTTEGSLVLNSLSKELLVL